MRQRDLDRLCEDWQRRLRLMDWEIEVRIVPSYEIPDRIGSSFQRVQERTAVVKLCRLDEVPPDVDPRQLDLEITLVHELLHIWVAEFRPYVKEDRDEERAINALALALVEAVRGFRPGALTHAALRAGGQS